MCEDLKRFFYGLSGVAAALAVLLFFVYGTNTPEVFTRLAQYTPQLLTGSVDYSEVNGGFLINISISIFSMMIAVASGCAIGIGMISPSKIIRCLSTLIMNGLRNAPWLVILYAMLYLLPFQIEIMGKIWQFPPFLKAILGLSLPVMANMAEILRGSMETIHAGQWEAARALGYRPMQVLRRIIIPQAIPRMIPNVMNLYAMLVIGSSLIVVTGTADVLSIARTITATQGQSLATGLYIYVLFMFFVYCYPIAALSRWFERRMLGGAI